MACMCVHTHTHRDRPAHFETNTFFAKLFFGDQYWCNIVKHIWFGGKISQQFSLCGGRFKRVNQGLSVYRNFLCLVISSLPSSYCPALRETQQQEPSQTTNHTHSVNLIMQSLHFHLIKLHISIGCTSTSITSIGLSLLFKIHVFIFELPSNKHRSRNHSGVSWVHSLLIPSLPNTCLPCWTVTGSCHELVVPHCCSSCSCQLESLWCRTRTCSWWPGRHYLKQTILVLSTDKQHYTAYYKIYFKNVRNSGDSLKCNRYRTGTPGAPMFLFF